MRSIERWLSIEDIKPNPRNARTHSNKQIQQIANSINACGFGSSVLVDETLTLIAGHGRLKAAELLGIKEIPAVELRGLSPAQKRALALAENKIADNAGWDRKQLSIELSELSEVLIEEGQDISSRVLGRPKSISCWSISKRTPPIQATKSIRRGKRPGGQRSRQSLDSGSAPPSLWGRSQRARYSRLMGASRAAMAFLDVPYNVPVRSIGGRGRTRHAEFAMASGEMSSSEYVDFLVAGLGNSRGVS